MKVLSLLIIFPFTTIVRAAQGEQALGVASVAGAAAQPQQQPAGALAHEELVRRAKEKYKKELFSFIYHEEAGPRAALSPSLLTVNEAASFLSGYATTEVALALPHLMGYTPVEQAYIASIVCVHDTTGTGSEALKGLNNRFLTEKQKAEVLDPMRRGLRMFLAAKHGSSKFDLELVHFRTTSGTSPYFAGFLASALRAMDRKWIRVSEIEFDRRINMILSQITTSDVAREVEREIERYARSYHWTKHYEPALEKVRALFLKK